MLSSTTALYREMFSIADKPIFLSFGRLAVFTTLKPRSIFFKSLAVSIFTKILPTDVTPRTFRLEFTSIIFRTAGR